MARIIELIETIVVYTFPNRSRQEIADMLGLTDLKETRVYQEGREEEARLLVLKLLTRKLGSIPDRLRDQVNQLPLETLEALSEALFDFSEMSELGEWLAQKSESSHPHEN
jgi:predicted transposase YdaD